MHTLRLLGLLVLLAPPASANYTVDLIWTDTNLPTISLYPGDSVPLPPDPPILAGPAGSHGPCASGAQSGAGVGRCLEIWLTADAQWSAAIVTLGWNAASSGLAVDFVSNLSFGQFGAGPPAAAPVGPNPALPTDCAANGCDTAYGSFGGLSAVPIPAGTYRLGSINFDTSGLSHGIHDILLFLRTGVDGVTDKKSQFAPVQLNGALKTDEGGIVPEPSTAGLVGLGIFVLSLFGRARD